MDNSSLVSILIPNYNKVPYLRDTLDSILAQTYSNWECIIVDDHSTDGSWEILGDYPLMDSRFKIFKRPEQLPKGGNTCRNYGLSLSNGNYILFLDSDDVLADFCLSQRIQSVKENQALDFWAFPTVLFEIKPSDARFYWNLDNSSESDLSRFLRMDALWQTSGCLYKRDFLLKLEGLSPNRKFWQDYELHLKALLSSQAYKKFFHLPPDVFIRNGDSSSLSRSTPFSADLKILVERINFLEEIFDYSKSIGKDLSRTEVYSLFSFQFYLIVQLWVKHGKFGLFWNRWLNYTRLYGLNSVDRWRGLIKSCQIKLNNRINLNFLKAKVKTSSIPDYDILKDVEIGIHPLSTKSSIDD